MALAAVTGLAAEARILQRRGIEAVATGGDPERTAAAVERILATAASLMSFGIAGALAPGLAPGTLLLPRRVVSEGTAITVDEAWRGRVDEALRALGLRPVADDILGATAIIAAPEEKARLHRRTGAVAVDLESHIAAVAAQRLSRPFMVLRAVADPAGFALPPAAAVGLDAAGRAALLPVLGSILRDPAQVPALLRLARHTRRALAALTQAAAALSWPGGEG
ncbi:MAG TPA: hopanoid-associated phosphorylase [Stellaceae bacterium]|nr:hopanoid-associated phosphorylase [Stellaceae bacterium]